MSKQLDTNSRGEPRVQLTELVDIHPCPTCREESQGGPATFIGSHQQIGNVASRMYSCKNRHIWTGMVPVECKVDPEFQKQLWNALRPDLCCFCHQPFTDSRETFGEGEHKICHTECRNNERRARGIF